MATAIYNKDNSFFSIEDMVFLMPALPTTVGMPKILPNGSVKQARKVKVHLLTTPKRGLIT